MEVSEEDLTVIFNTMDKKGSGEINIEDFLKMIEW